MVNAKEGLLMPRFKEMVCPVCGKTDFDLPKGSGKENKLRYYGQGRIVCYYCGWIYDANQAANPESKRGQNELSVVEMREDYQARIAKEPNYYWFSTKRIPWESHVCPVCREHRFPNEPSFDICPVCGWQDDGMEANPEMESAIGLTYPDAVKEFKEKRTKNPYYRWAVEVRQKRK